MAAALKTVWAEHLDAKQLRPVVAWFEAGHTVRAGDHVPSAEYARQLRAAPVLAEAVDGFLTQVVPADVRAALPEALAAAEFILEGLRLDNKLNKSRQGGATLFGR